MTEGQVSAHLTRQVQHKVTRTMITRTKSVSTIASKWVEWSAPDHSVRSSLEKTFRLEKKSLSSSSSSRCAVRKSLKRQNFCRSSEVRKAFQTISGMVERASITSWLSSYLDRVLRTCLSTAVGSFRWRRCYYWQTSWYRGLRQCISEATYIGTWSLKTSWWDWKRTLAHSTWSITVLPRNGSSQTDSISRTARARVWLELRGMLLQTHIWASNRVDEMT